MAIITVYGIPNCDTTKKAMQWLRREKLDFSFHDYKLKGINKQQLEGWCDQAGWELIFNKRSTTWRELGEAVQRKIIDQPSAIKVMVQHNSIIKRPVIEFGNKLLIGFNEEKFSKHLK